MMNGSKPCSPGDPQAPSPAEAQDCECFPSPHPLPRRGKTFGRALIIHRAHCRVPPKRDISGTESNVRPSAVPEPPLLGRGRGEGNGKLQPRRTRSRNCQTRESSAEPGFPKLAMKIRAKYFLHSLWSCNSRRSLPDTHSSRHEFSPRRGLRLKMRLIYVVDDVPDLTENTTLLEATGYIVRAFNDRAEALAAWADRTKPDLLITTPRPFNACRPVYMSAASLFIPRSEF